MSKRFITCYALPVMFLKCIPLPDDFQPAHQ